MDLGDKIASVVGYLGGLTILVWALLKATGVINTPIWVEMIPYASASIALLVFVYQAGKLVNRFEVIEYDVHALKNDFSGLKEDVGGLKALEKTIARIEHEVLGLKESQKRLATIVLQKA